MKHSIYAAAFLSALATADPQWGPGGQGGVGGPWAAFPSCVSSCRDQNIDYNSYSSLCSNNDALNTLSTCVDNSSCSDDDKRSVKETIAQLCVNAGVTVTAAPYTTFSVTSGGSAWPSAWTSNSAWNSVVSAWNSGNITAAPGWHGGGYGPFGRGGPGGSGWGNGPWTSNGGWTDGPWTNWWGTGACPPSTWTGWTDGSWSTNAPWTTWTGCTAETTTTSVYTATITTNGAVQTTVTTSYGYGRVAEATNRVFTSSGTVYTTTNTDSGAMPTNFAMLGSAAGALGVLAGAILL